MRTENSPVGLNHTLHLFAYHAEAVHDFIVAHEVSDDIATMADAVRRPSTPRNQKDRKPSGKRWRFSPTGSRGHWRRKLWTGKCLLSVLERDTLRWHGYDLSQWSKCNASFRALDATHLPFGGRGRMTIITYLTTTICYWWLCSVTWGREPWKVNSHQLY